MDSGSPDDPRDQFITLMSSFLHNSPTARVNPRPATSNATSVYTEQVRLTDNASTSRSNQAQIATESPDVVIARATERQLEQNALYMRVKMLATDQTAEIAELQEANTKLREENGALKERSATLK